MSGMLRNYHGCPSGWADDRLMDAYDLIWAVQQENPAEPEFGALLKDIERADDILNEVRRNGQ